MSFTNCFDCCSTENIPYGAVTLEEDETFVTLDKEELLESSGKASSVVLDSLLKLKGKQGRLLVKENGLAWFSTVEEISEGATPQWVILWKHLIGANCFRHFQKSFLLRCCYISKDFKKLKAQKPLKFRVHSLIFSSTNTTIVTKWVSLIRRKLVASGQARFVRITIFVNPFSGNKNARKVLRKVMPIFQSAGCNLTIVETTHPGHCKEYASKMSLNRVYRIVCVSGDGLMNECINGLMSRPDWQQAARIPLGIIPAGSGNAIATCIGATDPITAAMYIIKGKTKPIDLNVMYQRDEVTNGWRVVRYGIMGLLWALISDIDIESEYLRFLGPLRFNIAALKRIISLKRYSGTLYYLPDPQYSTTNMTPCTFDETCEKCRFDSITDSIRLDVDKNLSTGEISMKGFNPDDFSSVDLDKSVESDFESEEFRIRLKKSSMEESDNEEYVYNLRGNKLADKTHSRVSLASDSDAEEKHLHFGGEKLETVFDSRIDEEPVGFAEDGFSVVSGLPPGFKSIISRDPLEDPEWKKIDLDNLTYLVALNVSFISGSFRAAPYAHFSDGSLDLIYTMETRKLKLLEHLNTGITGSYVSDPAFHYLKVKALVLVPQAYGGIIDLDGEVVKNKDSMLEVFPGVLKILC